MKVLCHHIYEYKKGLRNLVLHTMSMKDREAAIKKLELNHIDFLISTVNQSKINVFFGAPECIAVLKRFGNKKLNEFSPEEDFILGIMLGYSRIQQCNRYLSMKMQKVKPNESELRA